jgi:hypothetical protein
MLGLICAHEAPDHAAAKQPTRGQRRLIRNGLGTEACSIDGGDKYHQEERS